MRIIKEGFWSGLDGIPGMLMDWGTLVLLMWLFSLTPDWRVGLIFVGVSFPAFIVRAAIRDWCKSPRT